MRFFLHLPTNDDVFTKWLASQTFKDLDINFGFCGTVRLHLAVSQTNLSSKIHNTFGSLISSNVYVSDEKNRKIFKLLMQWNVDKKNTEARVRPDLMVNKSNSTLCCLICRQLSLPLEQYSS